MRYAMVSNGKKYLIVDTKVWPHKVICVCSGWNKFEHAGRVMLALEKFNAELYDTFMPKEKAS